MWPLSLDEGVLNHEGEKLSSTGRKKMVGGGPGKHVTEGQYSPPGRKG